MPVDNFRCVNFAQRKISLLKQLLAVPEAGLLTALSTETVNNNCMVEMPTSLQ
jgi:hypothetical protein